VKTRYVGLALAACLIFPALSHAQGRDHAAADGLPAEAARVPHADLRALADAAGLPGPEYAISNVTLRADGWHVGVLRHFQPFMPNAATVASIRREMKRRGATMHVTVEPGYMVQMHPAVAARPAAPRPTPAERPVRRGWPSPSPRQRYV